VRFNGSWRRVSPSQLWDGEEDKNVNWGAPNSGFYATVGQGNQQVNCQPQLVVRPESVTQTEDTSETNFILAARVLRCRTIMIGAARPNHMVEFRGSFARNFGGPGAAVEVGFVQNLLSSTRIADYQGGRRLWRDGSPVGAGLLDCGANAHPWFQGNSMRLFPPTAGAQHGMPAVVSCGDNPRWTVPLTLEGSPLTRVVLKNNFRLFAVAKVNNSFVPICCTNWATDITWEPQGITRRAVTKDPTWMQPTPAHPVITAGQTANAILVDQIG
jgi:hypothetical protein